MKEFFQQREPLYRQRKAFMLARLQREHELLVNKVKFIQGVISEEIQIRRVARKPLIQALVAFGLKPISKINAIMA